jgi:hypothetical protein
MDDKAQIVATGILLAVLLLLGAAWWVFSSAQEANAFNRLTGGHATTWDAMWAELRVQGAPADQAK